MKIALCISGYLRCFQKTYISLLHNILNHYDCDIFISTWDLDAKTEKKVSSLYRPKAIESDSAIHVDSKYQTRVEPHRNVHGPISMFYKINKCDMLRRQYAAKNNIKYDLVIRSRSDLLFSNKLEIPLIESNEILFPRYGNYLGYNDQFAIGTSEAMKDYASLYNNLENYYNERQLFLPEMLLKYHLDTNGYKAKRLDTKYVILRENGTVLNNEAFENYIMRMPGYISSVRDLQQKVQKSKP